MASTSYSEVQSFLTCRRKHYYGYLRSLEKNITSSGLARGKVGHAVLETYYRTILEEGNSVEDQQKGQHKALNAAYQKFQELIDSEDVDDGKHIPLEEQLFEWYFPYEPLVRKGWQVLAVEQEFNLEYDEENNLTLPFIVDLIAYDPSGDMVVVDHKFLLDFYNQRSVNLQSQIPTYVAALRSLGYPIIYGLYNMLRTRPLKTSSTNKLSDRIFQLKLEASEKRVLRSFDEHIDVADQINYVKGLEPDEQDRKSFRAANNLVCKSCPFNDLCSMELEGVDTYEYITKAFHKKKRKTFTNISKEASNG